jgi:hypothetical protein
MKTSSNNILTRARTHTKCIYPAFISLLHLVSLYFFFNLYLNLRTFVPSIILQFTFQMKIIYIYFFSDFSFHNITWWEYGRGMSGNGRSTTNGCFCFTRISVNSNFPANLIGRLVSRRWDESTYSLETSVLITFVGKLLLSQDFMDVSMILYIFNFNSKELTNFWITT